MRSFVPLLVLALVSTIPAGAAGKPSIGSVDIDADRLAMPVRVSASSPELQNIALRAFELHGAYRLVRDDAAYSIAFTQTAPTQVRVDVTPRDGGLPLSETVTDAGARQAMLRAADLAVARTNGKRGFFSGKLAFVVESGGAMRIMTTDFLTDQGNQWNGLGRQIVFPRWAPDGRRIVFTSYRGGFPDIYLLNTGTTANNITELVRLRGTNSGGRFSPDGARLAMVLSGEGNPEIYLANAQGRNIARLTRTPGVEASPCWSPDGSKLVFTSEPGPQLHVMPAVVGAQPRRLPTNISRYCAEPDWCRWNPDLLAFTIAVGRNFQIAVYNFSTGQARQVSKAPFDAVEPCWLADGRHLIYTARAANQSSLWVLDTETGRARQLSHSSGKVSQASFWIR